MLWPEYVRRHGTLSVSNVSFGAFSLILAHSVCGSNVSEDPANFQCDGRTVYVNSARAWFYNVPVLSVNVVQV